MPELPEAQTIASDLDGLIKGRSFQEIVPVYRGIVDHRSLPMDSFLEKTIQSVTRVGKMILFTLDDALSVLVSLRMTGQFILGSFPKGTTLPEFPPHVRLALRLDKGVGEDSHDALLYRDIRKLGVFYFADPSRLAAILDRMALGKDALTADPGYFHDKASSRESPLKSLLLDQSLLSGLGNIYATEALFAAKLSPFRRGSSLTKHESSLLMEKVRSILTDAIANRGSTVSNYQAPLGAGSYQGHHQAYGKAGQNCPVCGTPFTRSLIGGRSTVWCEGCQK
jgi:formamidopyrimidine-DNA glycosylase